MKPMKAEIYQRRQNKKERLTGICGRGKETHTRKLGAMQKNYFSREQSTLKRKHTTWGAGEVFQIKHQKTDFSESKRHRQILEVGRGAQKHRMSQTEISSALNGKNP